MFLEENLLKFAGRSGLPIKCPRFYFDASSLLSGREALNYLPGNTTGEKKEAERSFFA